MLLSALFKSIVRVSSDIDIKGIAINANNVTKGDLFIAIKGSTDNGIKYKDIAINNGAVAIAVDSNALDNKNLKINIPCIYIDNLTNYLVILASRFYKKTNNINLIAITGTNGKTSSSIFLSQLLTLLKIKNIVIGTLGVIANEKKIKLANTTPDIFTIYKTLDYYASKKITTAILEVSSHALVQNRIQGLNIKSAIFTNLTKEHLDYHKTMANYLKAKQKLFKLDSLATVIVNTDDNNALSILTSSKAKTKIGYGLKPVDKSIKLDKFISFDNITKTSNGFICSYKNHKFEINLLGEFNLLNILAALSQLVVLGFSIDEVLSLLTRLKPIVGRMQKINNKNIWVDYAHTPDALEQSLKTLKLHFPKNKITLVFGCGGNRDKTKRALMGKVAANLADNIILTNDNPRFEEPIKIINDIKSGIKNKKSITVIMDRRIAIKESITKLKDNNCVLIAGKGHETEQVIANKTLKFNDAEVVEKLL